MVQTSADVYVKYGFEEVAYGTVAALREKNFGDISSFTAGIDNSMISVPGLGDQDPAAQVAGNFVGTWSADFVCRDFWWWAGIIGDVSSVSAGSAYDHTWTYDDLCDPMSIEYGIDATTDSVRTLLGAQMNTATLNVNIGEAVTASISGVHKTETEVDTGIDATPPASVDAPFTAAQASVSLWGSAITPVTTCTLTINRNISKVWGLGSRLPTARYGGIRTVDVALTLPFEDVAELIDDMYGANGAPSSTAVAEPAGTTTLTITNGSAGADERTLLITLAASKLFPATHTTTLPAGDMITEDATLVSRELTGIVWTNATSIEPADE